METTTTKATKTTTKRTAATTPVREAIEYRAYEIYLQRGGCEGNELEDWLAAEKELAPTKPARKPRAA